MSRFGVTRVGALLLLLSSVVACSDDDKGTSPAADSGWPGDWPDKNDAGHDAGVVGDAARPADIDASADASVVADSGTNVARTTACLDRPDTLPAAPSGPLPCELLPPGLVL